jgi:fermentation-respiration switch protein FrsA (DUF1100 family)
MNKSSEKPKSFLKKFAVMSIFALAIFIVGMYVVLSPTVCESLGLFNGVLFYPDTQHYDISKLEAQIAQLYHTKVRDVTFVTRDSAKLHGYFIRLPGAKKVILYSHGNGGNIDYRLACATSLLSLGCSVFLYDYEGYGSSGGTPTLAHVCEDAVCAFDVLVNHEHYQPKDIVLYGESLGTGVTCELLKKRQCGGIILMSGFASLVATGKDCVPWLRLYPDFLFIEPRMDNAAILSRPHPPLLIVHGAQDTVLSYVYSEELAQSACPPKQFVGVPDGDHVSPVYSNLFLKAARPFIAALP